MDQDLREDARDNDAFVARSPPKARESRRVMRVERVEVRDQDAGVQD